MMGVICAELAERGNSDESEAESLAEKICSLGGFRIRDFRPPRRPRHFQRDGRAN